jgi:DNA-nicking Smr family endonuclease
MSRDPRNLNSEDLEIWRFVTRSVTPYNDMATRHPNDDPADDRSDAPATRRKPAFPPPTDPTPLPVPRPPPPLAVGVTADIDRRTAQRFTRGDMAIDGRIDLHGLTLDQAHGALVSFMRSASARGARCVVVVTGKGKDQTIGKIRREAPHWLNQASLRSLIIAISQARPRQGGAGALYVLLKRKR